MSAGPREVGWDRRVSNGARGLGKPRGSPRAPMGLGGTGIFAAAPRAPRAQVVPEGGGPAAPRVAGAARRDAGADAALTVGRAEGRRPGAAPGPAPPALRPHPPAAPLRPPRPARIQAGAPTDPLPFALSRSPEGLKAVGWGGLGARDEIGGRRRGGS